MTGRLAAYLKGWPTRPRRESGYHEARGLAALAIVAVLAAVTGVLTIVSDVPDAGSWVKGFAFLALSAVLARLFRTYLRRPVGPPRPKRRRSS